MMLGDQSIKNVTVLFSDIRGYTSLAEKMTLQENFKFVNALNRRMGPIISANDGFVNQYLGDAIMAIFPDGAESALCAAIGMQKALIQYNKSRSEKGRDQIRIGIGFHTGDLIMGIIGDQTRMDAATISDTVNTASRIESLTKHCGASVLLTEHSVEKLINPDSFGLRFLGQVQVKGKEEAIGIYECFDGDADDLIKLKQGSLEEFNKGVKQFVQGNFQDAFEVFNSIVKLHPSDAVAGIMAQKCKLYSDSIDPKDWDGVESMQFK